MKFNQYVRRPFVAKAIEITSENIEQIAKVIGFGEVRTQDGAQYILCDRRVVPIVRRAFVGWFLTKVGGSYRCYAPEIFWDQFTDFAPSVTFTFESISDESPEEDPEKVVLGVPVTDETANDVT